MILLCSICGFSVAKCDCWTVAKLPPAVVRVGAWRKRGGDAQPLLIAGVTPESVEHRRAGGAEDMGDAPSEPAGLKPFAE